MAHEHSDLCFTDAFVARISPVVVGNTPVGANVVVRPVDASGRAPVTVTFTSVSQGGVTSLATGSGGLPPPPGFQLGTPPVYFDLTTTAVFIPPVTVCIGYTGIVFAGPPRLFHLEGGVWVDRTVSVDTTNLIICASVESLSSFAIFALLNRPPVADAGPDRVFECTGYAGRNVVLDGSASSDPDGDVLSYRWTDENGGVAGTTATVSLTVPLGIHAFTLTVDDRRGGIASAVTHVTVRDTTPPVISITIPAAAAYAVGQVVNAAYSCSDTCTGRATCDGAGKPGGTAQVVSAFRLVGIKTGSTLKAVDQAVASATKFTTFQWDTLLSDWFFVINTSVLAKGCSYFYRITLNDGSTINFTFGIT